MRYVTLGEVVALIDCCWNPLVVPQEDLAAVRPEGIRKGIVGPGDLAGRLVVGSEDGHRRHLRNLSTSLQA